MEGIRLAPEILTKTPDEARLFNFDFSGDDLAEDSNVVAVQTIDVLPTGDAEDLVVADPIFSGKVVQVMSTKGVLGVLYGVKVRAEFTLGQVLELVGRVRVGPAGE